jgi:hypothetical protein
LQGTLMEDNIILDCLLCGITYFFTVPVASISIDYSWFCTFAHHLVVTLLFWKVKIFWNISKKGVSSAILQQRIFYSLKHLNYPCHITTKIFNSPKLKFLMRLVPQLAAKGLPHFVRP